MVSFKRSLLVGSLVTFCDVAFISREVVCSTAPTSPTSDLAVASFKPEEVKDIKLINMSGEVSLTAVESSDILVSSQKINWSETACSYTASIIAKTLYLEVKRADSAPSGSFNSNPCHMNLAVKLPSRKPIDVKIGSGNTVAQGLKGPVDISSGSGNVTLNKVESAHVTIKTGSGDVHIEGSMDAGKINCGSGNIKVDYSSAPTTGSLAVKVGSGNVGLSYPASSSINVDFKSGSGSLSSDFANSAQAPYQVNVKSGSGNLTIHKR